jgi:hypothetical protein
MKYRCPKCVIYQAGAKLTENAHLREVPPRGPRMKCGWGCGEQFTGRSMRAHFRNMREAAGGLLRRGRTREELEC